MAKPNLRTIKPIIPQKDDRRSVEIYFSRLDGSHQHPTNRLLHFICVPLMVLGVVGLAWAIPFPQFAFLAAYKGYFNWASFVIAFWIYYCLKQSPLLSYAMLFMLFGFSYGVMQLANWEKAGGIPLIWVSTLIIAIAALGQYIGGRLEGNSRSWDEDQKLFLISPIWVLHQLLAKLGIKRY